MLEELIPVIWASMQSWLTPTIFFVVLNLVIGTILATSGVGSPKPPGEKPQEGDDPSKEQPATLEKKSAFNLHKLRVDESPSVNTKTDAVVSDEILSVEEVFDDGTDEHHLERGRSDTHPTAGEVPGKLSRKMKKSASDMSAFSHFKETKVVVQWHPQSVRVGQRMEERSADQDSSEDGVDAKADDFINRFKQELKLQRMESIMSYKEMLYKGN